MRLVRFIRYGSLGFIGIFTFLAVQACSIMDASKALLLILFFWLLGSDACQNNQIAFVSYDGNDDEIYVINPDGTGLKQLTNNDEDDNAPVWSCDGQWIAYESYDGSDDEIYVMRADGSERKRLTKNDSDDDDPAFSRDGTMIAWEAENGAGGTDVAVINRDGSGFRRVTHAGGDDDRDVSWSSDGRQLAFIHENGNEKLFVVNLDGSGLKALQGADETSDPNWHPRQSQIAFTFGPGTSDRRINLINPDGTGLTPLTSSLAASDDPNWNQAGNLIVFESDLGNNAIYVMDASGGNLQRLSTGNASATDGVWSADSRQIAYSQGNRIYLVSPSGQNRTILTTTPPSDSDNDHELAWLYTGTEND